MICVVCGIEFEQRTKRRNQVTCGSVRCVNRRKNANQWARQIARRAAAATVVVAPTVEPVKAGAVYKVVRVLPDDWDMRGAELSKIEVEAMKSLATLPECGMIEADGRLFEVQDYTFHGARRQRLVEV